MLITSDSMHLSFFTFLLLLLHSVHLADADDDDNNDDEEYDDADAADHSSNDGPQRGLQGVVPRKRVGIHVDFVVQR